MSLMKMQTIWRHFSWVSTFISQQFGAFEHYGQKEYHSCVWLHPYGTDRLWRDPAGPLHPLPPDIPDHCAGECGDDPDNPPGFPA